MLSIAAFLVGVVYSVVTTSYDALPVISLYLVYSLATNFIEVFHAIDQRHLRLDFAGKSYVMQGIGTLVAFAVGLWFFDSLLVAVGLMTRSSSWSALCMTRLVRPCLSQFVRGCVSGVG
mgnify:CR=1 FL=1